MFNKCTWTVWTYWTEKHTGMKSFKPEPDPSMPLPLPVNLCIDPVGQFLLINLNTRPFIGFSISTHLGIPMS